MLISLEINDVWAPINLKVPGYLVLMRLDLGGNITSAGWEAERKVRSKSTNVRWDPGMILYDGKTWG